MTKIIKMNNEEELKDFVLQDEKIDDNNNPIYEVMGTSDDIQNFDFSSDEEFNLDEKYEYVEKLNIIEKTDNNENEIKKREAVNIVNKYSKLFIDENFVDEIDKSYDNFKMFLRKFSTEKQEVKDMTEQQRTKIYGIGSYLFNKHNEKYKDIYFKFDLTVEELKFIHNVFNNKLEYGPDEVFQIAELKKNYLNNYININKNEEQIQTQISVNMLIILYHLISTYKSKGINKEFYIYMNILTKIGERVKLINAYNILVERLNADFSHWISMLNSLDMVTETIDEE